MRDQNYAIVGKQQRKPKRKEQARCCEQLWAEQLAKVALRRALLFEKQAARQDSLVDACNSRKHKLRVNEARLYDEKPRALGEQGQQKDETDRRQRGESKQCAPPECRVALVALVAKHGAREHDFIRGAQTPEALHHYDFGAAARDGQELGVQGEKDMGAGHCKSHKHARKEQGREGPAERRAHAGNDQHQSAVCDCGPPAIAVCKAAPERRAKEHAAEERGAQQRAGGVANTKLLGDAAVYFEKHHGSDLCHCRDIRKPARETEPLLERPKAHAVHCVVDGHRIGERPRRGRPGWCVHINL
eukprot:comp16191_c0_seq1/m.25595 comp16191_c0_seq1/g.25595  ORF comp16191_c0_seq1/g.25595 comp16191_c0_seq1/m.25595 type:complete len:302 (-) comp16191_c0_seq1:59-964(-)